MALANTLEETGEWTCQRLKILTGNLKTGGKSGTGDRSKFSMKRWQFMLNADFKVSDKCCKVMKKEPAHAYEKETGLMPIIATMASESHMRRQKWLQEGCNAYEGANPSSKPMSFWTEQDVLLYLYLNNLPIPSVYGDIVPDRPVPENVDTYGMFDEEMPFFKTTKLDRTGCMFCLFGIHMEGKDGPNRLELMKETHPKQFDYIMRSESEGGLGYREKIEWINENSKLDIKY